MKLCWGVYATRKCNHLQKGSKGYLPEGFGSSHVGEPKVEGLIVGGTTGEGHLLSLDERIGLISHTKACGKVLETNRRKVLIDSKRMAERSKKLRYFIGNVPFLSISFFDPFLVYLRLDTLDDVLIPLPTGQAKFGGRIYIVRDLRDVTGKVDPNKLPGKWNEAGLSCKLIEADSEDLNESP